MEIPAKTGLNFKPRWPTHIRPGWEGYLFIGLALVALGLRLWELDGRTMHYDESLHVHYAWRLAMGDGYSHSPWMHGPFQVNMTALFLLISDTDYAARLGFALFGSALVALPYFLRSYLGRVGAILTAVMLALSPSLLYFSRFGRNDILMVFWAVALLALMWRYLNEGKTRYLYLASAVLALAFATKETSYMVVGIFGVALFLMSLTEIIPWILGRIRLSDMSPAPVFLLLMVTLTLPQWSALVSIPLTDSMLDLVEDGVGDVGLPVSGAPSVSFPLVDLHLALDILIVVGIVGVPLAAVMLTRKGRRLARWLLPGAALAALAFAFVAFPGGTVARGYLVTLGILVAALLISIVLGLMWRWKVWLVCAAIFYGIWSLLYTSVYGVFVQNHGFCPNEDVGGFFDGLCAKVGGLYTGSWQGLAYWIEQQEVGRANQPWYYHFLIMSVYEFLPLIFGAVAVFYYLRKNDLFGTMLAFWAVATIIIYTVASEKMPWLLVNMAVPLILLSGKFMGELVERVNWRTVLQTAPSALLILAPMLLLGIVYLLHTYLDQEGMETWRDWGLLATIIIAAGISAILVKWARPRVGITLAGVGVAVLLLGFSTFVGFRASYNYDDTPIEMLVYAQGSSDLVNTVDALSADVFNGATDGQVVEIDYELWYPLNWYVRQEQKDGTLGFKCYKDEDEFQDGEVVPAHCKPLEEPPSTSAILLNVPHGKRDSKFLEELNKEGPFKNLLWFPEKYRRPGEDRKKESLFEELKADLPFAKDSITSCESWKGGLAYFLFRRLDSDWLNSTYFSYISPEGPSGPYPESTEGRPWGQPLKKPAGAPLNLG